jgi:hypothetical protein
MTRYLVRSYQHFERNTAAFILDIEEVCSSETLVTIYQITQKTLVEILSAENIIPQEPATRSACSDGA